MPAETPTEEFMQKLGKPVATNPENMPVDDKFRDRQNPVREEPLPAGNLRQA